MNRKWIWAALAVLGIASTAYAASYNRVPSATFANASTVCGAVTGNQCFITDCLTSACTAGGGALAALSQYNGSAWVLVAPAAAGGAGAITGTTSDTFTLDSDGDALVLDPQAGGITFDRAASGTVTISSTDDDTTAAMTLDPGGNTTLTLGAAADTVTVAASTGLTLGNAESLNTGTDAAFDFTRDDAGAVTLTSSDNDSTAALTVDPGGNATLTLGSASDTVSVAATTGVTLSNSESLSNGTNGTLTLGRNDSGTVTVTAADDDATAALTVAPGGAAALTLGGASATAVVHLSDSDTQLQNGATGNVDLSFHDYADTTDDDQAHALLRTNCTDTGTGAEDCDFTVGVAEAGAAPETRFTIDADGGITVGSANNNSATVTTDGTGDGEVVLPDSSVSGQDEVGGGMLMQAIFCGDLPNNTTNYTSPITGYPGGIFYDAGLTGSDLSYTLAGTGCAAEDNTTEGTADEVMFTQRAVKALGLYCRVSSSGANGVTLRLRSATANVTPDLTCTIATGSTECVSYTPTTTDIAANATVAVSAVSTEDLSAQDYWCMVQFSLQ